jgi:tetratricopeptide (TPR) repeat protein
VTPSVPGGTPVQVTGLVQGLVVGDANTVTQHFHVVRHEPVHAREAPALPDFWVDRPALADRALALLLQARPAVVALLGMGGAGKSRLAARVAAALEPACPGGCFWVDLRGDSVDAALLRIALACGHDISLLPSTAARAATVRTLLAGRRVLLVLDDVVSPEDTSAFLPPPPGCAVLLTTRNDAVASAVADEVLEVPPLEPQAALALLAGAAGAPVDEPALPAVAAALGGLPLALELAGRFARQQSRRAGFSWAALLERLAEGRARLDLGLAGRSVRLAFDTTWDRALDDALRDAFARLGLFEARDLGMAEVAAAWGLSPAEARPALDALLDLSLLRTVAPSSFRLHPLLHDYAAERARVLGADVRREVHRRVAEHHLAQISAPPRTLAELAPALHAHWHAAAAGDRELARRAYPWLAVGPGPSMAVPAFLIDRGQRALHLRHERLHHALGSDDPPWARCVAERHLAQVMLDAGEAAEATRHLEEAVRLLDSDAVDDDQRVLSLGSTLMAAGRAHASAGNLDRAEALLQRAVAWDRAVEAGGTTIGAGEGACIAQLQLADLQQQRGDRTAARATALDAARRAAAAGYAQPAAMALQRLVQLDRADTPAAAVHWIDQALVMVEQSGRTFAGRQGARYARLLGEAAADLALAGHASGSQAQRLLAIAIRSAGEAGAVVERGWALVRLGQWLERVVGDNLQVTLGGAWACYEVAAGDLADLDEAAVVIADIRQRLQAPVWSRLDNPARAALAEAVAADAWSVIDAALSPGAVGPGSVRVEPTRPARPA